jgi:hypothetical protein
VTEADWLACTDDPYSMLNYLGKRVSSRKARLLACACFRRKTPALKKWEQQIVDIAERFADGLASPEALQQAQDQSVGKSGVAWVTMDMDYWTAVEAARAAGEWRDESEQCSLVRDIFGNPYRPLPPKKGKRQWNDKLAVWLKWNDGTVVKLALSIYDDRVFDRLPILADALEEAGCSDSDILSHCRSGGEHVRGCWVVNLLLGKT